MFVRLCFFSLSLSLKREMKSSNTNALTVITCQKVFIEVPVYDTVYESVLMKETNYFFYLWRFLVGEAGKSVNVNFHPHWKLFR